MLSYHRHPFIPALFLFAPALAAEPVGVEERWKSEALPVMERYCHDCHADGIRKGELSLEPYQSIADMQADRDVWKRIRDHLRQRLMPPLDEDQPSDAEREKLLAWIDDAVFPVDPEKPDPGRVTLRRLNRVEYQNTLRDLLQKNVKVIDLIPPDDSGYGFDNIGDVLTLSPSHLERYLEAARVALDATVVPGEMPRRSKRLRGRDFEGDGQTSEEGKFLATSGEIATEFKPERPGLYRITINAAGTPGGDEPPRMELRLGGEMAKAWDVPAPLERPEEHTYEVKFDSADPVRMEVAFTNDFWDEHEPDPGKRDRNLMVRHVTILGPLDGPPPQKPASHRRIFLPRKKGEKDQAYTLRVLDNFARRAFRRPPRDGEVERYLPLVALAKEEGLEQGVRLALEAMLVSPSFLYREEPQPAPDDAGEIHPIDEHSLATRLSYFLWSTMPDDGLLERASRGELRKHLSGEIDRMLKDRRAAQFTSNFTGQWLRLRDVPTSSPARKAFPKFEPRLRELMRRETEMLFSHIVQEDLPLDRLIDTDFTFVNAPLARHYGMEGVEGNEFRKVAVANPKRRGLLGHGSFHLLTSYPLRTSPVLRGKYVLENLLDTAPPPPPPNIPQLDPPGHGNDHASLRQQLERHREDPSCASCHALMDPIGFGLENFDATGKWRDEENGHPIDATGELTGGRKFHGVEELRAVLLRDHREDFHRAVAAKMLTYALGRGTDWYDKPALDRIVRETAAANGSSRAMIRAVVDSVPFQYRRGDGKS